MRGRLKSGRSFIVRRTNNIVGGQDRFIVSRPQSRGQAPIYVEYVRSIGPLIERSGMPLWIYRHTLFKVDYRLGTTRVLSNQRGSPREARPDFVPGW